MTFSSAQEAGDPVPHQNENSATPPLTEQSIAPTTGRYLNFESVFREQLGRVCRTLHSLGVQSSSVDDAAQDVFMVVHKKLSEFEGRSQLSTWIYAVTYRVAQNYRRHNKRRSHDALSEAEVCSSPGPAERLASQQASRFVQDFCSQLSEAKRDAFVLCVLEERAAPEVAQILSINLNTVYSRTRAARQEFRSALSRMSTSKERG